MDLNDDRIAHLVHLGGTRKEAIATLDERVRKGEGFLEAAQVTSGSFSDSSVPMKCLAYVAGTCGSREARGKHDLGGALGDVYSLLYFPRIVEENDHWLYNETLFTPNLREIVDYEILTRFPIRL